MLLPTFVGGVPERSKGADCKSAGSAFGGSNPPPSTMRRDGFKRVTETATLPEFEGQVTRVGVVICAGVVQRLEPQPSKLMMWVRFPSPAPVQAAAIVFRERNGSRSLVLESAHIAQSVEHFLGKEEVTGSIPVVGTIFRVAFSRFCQKNVIAVRDDYRIYFIRYRVNLVII